MVHLRQVGTSQRKPGTLAPSITGHLRIHSAQKRQPTPAPQNNQPE